MKSTDYIGLEVIEEVNRAVVKHGPMRSGHEGYSVLLEEVDELWQEVKHGTMEAARKEAIQVAAMAIRFIHDVCDKHLTPTDGRAGE